MTPHPSPKLHALRRPIASLLVATALVGAPGLATAQEAESTPIPGTARLEGRILRVDGKTPEPGATVRICSLDTATPVGSAIADEKGEFHVEGLAHGFVEIVVSLGDEVFAANQVVQLAPAERKAFDFVLVPTPDAPGRVAASPASPAACSDRRPTGSAKLQPRTTSGDFMRSKKGIAIVAGTGVAVLLLLTSGGEEAASPSNP